MSAFYQVAFWIMVLIVAWLVLVAINAIAAIKGQDKINNSTLDCLRALEEYVEKRKGSVK